VERAEADAARRRAEMEQAVAAKSRAEARPSIVPMRGFGLGGRVPESTGVDARPVVLPRHRLHLCDLQLSLFRDDYSHGRRR
jgi:hypothetical protein